MNKEKPIVRACIRCRNLFDSDYLAEICDDCLKLIEAEEKATEGGNYILVAVKEAQNAVIKDDQFFYFPTQAKERILQILTLMGCQLRR